MGSEQIIHYIQEYSYFIIFLFLFFGIVGIPSPEESLLFLVGVLAVHGQLSLPWGILFSFLGTFAGMTFGYYAGKLVGYPIINKYGKWIGITEEKAVTFEAKFTKNSSKTLIMGFFMPGLRQVAPYLSGIFSISIVRYLIISGAGSLLWAIAYILLGWGLGSSFPINPNYVPYLGVGLLVIFLVTSLTRYLRKKRKERGKI
ncbi:DedA family protein [Bacillus sp. Marseille-Q1617]|uniref:DedA family protein n=1 Tax=Bacillus sp. Marseille-Q1617 TaxID=2736887 RepID=UPI0015887144|nr:DedA family protein [Bacillus sp. Marseille-Q1617]